MFSKYPSCYYDIIRQIDVNSLDLLTHAINALSYATKYDYDFLGCLIRITDILRFTYEPAGDKT